jgi:hypothetical protein
MIPNRYGLGTWIFPSTGSSAPAVAPSPSSATPAHRNLAVPLPRARPPPRRQHRPGHHHRSAAPAARSVPDHGPRSCGRWAHADDLWLRRTAILAQLGAKAQTDTCLLEDCITANLIDSPYGGEFFVRKAIGWALRDYARTDAAWVHGILTRHEARLSPLSLREAGKHLR